MSDLQALDLKANPGAFSTLDMEVIIPDLEKLQPGDIYLEVGVDRGKSLSVARMVCKLEVDVIGVDIKEDPKVPGTLFYQGDSVKVANDYKEHNSPKISVLFIDGDHTYQGCKRDIDAWYPHVKKDGVLFFHDCDESSPGVMWAVAEFVYTHTGSFNLFKYNNKNTSMARVRLG
jgi:uncharacterized UPF0146 family protein